MGFKGTHFPCLALSVLVIIIIGCFGFDTVHCYNRPPPRKTLFVSHDGDDSSPQQVCRTSVTNYCYIYVLNFVFESLIAFQSYHDKNRSILLKFFISIISEYFVIFYIMLPMKVTSHLSIYLCVNEIYE
jgi:hypothetical protein